jgi:hypothetical protein
MPAEKPCKDNLRVDVVFKMARIIMDALSEKFKEEASIPEILVALDYVGLEFLHSMITRKDNAIMEALERFEYYFRVGFD